MAKIAWNFRIGYKQRRDQAALLYFALIVIAGCRVPHSSRGFWLDEWVRFCRTQERRREGQKRLIIAVASRAVAPLLLGTPSLQAWLSRQPSEEMGL